MSRLRSRHARGERDREVAAAAVGERELVIDVARNARGGRADELAHELGREARLRRVQEVEVAEERDLDPALPEPAAQVDAVRDCHAEQNHDDTTKVACSRMGFTSSGISSMLVVGIFTSIARTPCA